MQVNAAFCRTMQERMFPIGTNLTQANRALFREGCSGNQAAHFVEIGDAGRLDKEKPLRELALTSTVNSKSLLTQHTPAGHFWQGRWRHECNIVSQRFAGRH
ncbi:MAG: hypothetical protein ABJO27_08115 [Pseudoruegeria sp.]